MTAVPDPRPDLFCREYLKDFNGTRAYKAAGYKAKNDNVAASCASKLLRKPKTQQFLAEQVGLRFERLGIDVDRLVKEYTHIALADARDLVEVHKVACRFCYGQDHRYQETPAEEYERRKAWEGARTNWLARAKAGALPPANFQHFDALGGVGYDPRKPPAAECPECFGGGTERIVVHDTRDLPPEAARLYAGVKVTAEGMQVLTHDRSDALAKLGQHLGMFIKRVEHAGPDGGPIPLVNMSELMSNLSSDERAALRPILLKLAAKAKDPTS